MRKWYIAGCSLLVAALGASTIGAEKDSQPNPDIHASIQLAGEKTHVVGGPVILRLFVENTGKLPLTIVRPRSGLIDRHGGFWAGWRVTLAGPHGKMALPCVQMVPPRIESADLIELRKGESFGILIDITRAHFLNGQRGSRYMNEVAGEYSISAKYALEKGALRMLKKELASRTFLGPVASSTLKVNVTRGKRSPGKREERKTNES